MATQDYKVKAPDGHIITVRGPAGASQSEVIAQAQKLFAQRQQAAPAAPAEQQAAPMQQSAPQEPSMLQSIGNFSVDCCDNLAPISETVETDLEMGGTPPDTWGDEPVSDLEDWQQLVCGAAHAYVDYLKAMAQELEDLVALGAVSIGAIAGILALLSGAGILSAISYSTAASVVSAIIGSVTVGVFGNVPDDLEAARADIVCEIVHGDSGGMAAAIEGAISSLAWSAMYQYVDYSSARNVMLEGDHGGETLGVNRRTDCDCEVTGDVDVTFTFDANMDGWTNTSRAGWHASERVFHHPKSGNPPDPTNMQLNRTALATKAGQTEAAWKPVYLEIELSEDVTDPGFQRGRDVDVTVFYDDATSDVSARINTEGVHEIAVDSDKSLRSTAGGGTCIMIRAFSNGNATNGLVYVDNVRLVANNP